MKERLVYALLKKKDDLISKVENSKFTQHLTKDRKIRYEKVVKALILWFRDWSAMPRVFTDGEMLRVKANEFAKHLCGDGTPDDAVKTNWTDRFKKLYGIAKVTMSGDAASVDPKNVETWKNEELPEILRQYALVTSTTSMRLLYFGMPCQRSPSDLFVLAKHTMVSSKPNPESPSY